MAEILVYKKLKNMFPLAHWQRIENSVGVGIPDVNCCYKGVEVWFELKEGRLNKKTGQISIKFRPAQVAWIEKRIENGGKVFIALRYKCPPSAEGKFVFLKGHWARSISVLNQFPEHAIKHAFLTVEDLNKIFDGKKIKYSNRK